MDYKLVIYLILDFQENQAIIYIKECLMLIFTWIYESRILKLSKNKIISQSLCILLPLSLLFLTFYTCFFCTPPSMPGTDPVPELILNSPRHTAVLP